MDLFECERLNARITKATCERNRKRGGTGGYGRGAEKIFACDGCPGLRAKAKDKAMAVAKCTVKGCNKASQHNCEGMCKAHYREHVAAVKEALPTGPVIKEPAHYPDLDADAAEVKESFGKVTNADGDQASFGVDPLVHMALRDAWYEVERKALEALSGLAPASALIRAANLVQQIQRLEVRP